MDARKRGFPHAKPNGAAKRSKSESEFLSSGIRSKSKPCMKYFSTDGCPYGENCHFLHFFPGGYNAVAQLMNLPPISTAQTAAQNGPTSTIKSKLCNKYNSPEGCKFGDQCNFAHGDSELGKTIGPPHDHHQPLPTGRPKPPGAGATFGASATAKISVDASLTGVIIGKGGVNSKQICRQTGVKLSVRDHENDTNVKNIELEGTFDQIKEASTMVQKVILSVSVGHGPPRPPAVQRGPQSHGAITNKKTKLCENFTNGSCTFGERCRFAHGATELWKSVV